MALPLPCLRPQGPAPKQAPEGHSTPHPHPSPQPRTELLALHPSLGTLSPVGPFSAPVSLPGTLGEVARWDEGPHPHSPCPVGTILRRELPRRETFPSSLGTADTWFSLCPARSCTVTLPPGGPRGATITAFKSSLQAKPAPPTARLSVGLIHHTPRPGRNEVRPCARDHTHPSGGAVDPTRCTDRRKLGYWLTSGSREGEAEK